MQTETMEEITLTEDLEVGKAEITKEGRTYTEYDFVAKKGWTIRKTDSGFFESVSPPDNFGFITTFPIGKNIEVINGNTERLSYRWDLTIGKKVWKQALLQKNKKDGNSDTNG